MRVEVVISQAVEPYLGQRSCLPVPAWPSSPVHYLVLFEGVEVGPYLWQRSYLTVPEWPLAPLHYLVLFVGELEVEVELH